MKNFNIETNGPRNLWKEKGNSITLYSAAFEVYFKEKKFLFLAMHFWIFGFQIFEFVFERTNTHKTNE
jgi:hypothetical protein